MTRFGSAVPESVYKLDSEPTADIELPLCPSYTWPEKARPFVDLFPPRFVMTDKYADAITAEMWSLLAENGFVRTTPLFDTKERIRCFLADESLATDDDENQVESVESVTISQLAFLRMSNQGVIDRIRGSRERTIQFVEFLACQEVADDDETVAVEVGFKRVLVHHESIDMATMATQTSPEKKQLPPQLAIAKGDQGRCLWSL